MVIGKVYKRPLINASRPVAKRPKLLQAASKLPVSYIGRKRMLAAGAGRLAGGIVRGAVRAIPYADAALAVGGALKGAYNYIRGNKKGPGAGKRPFSSTTKFAGYVKKPSRGSTILDKCAKDGFVFKTEIAYETDSVPGGGTTGQQVLYQAHSTMPSQMTLFCCMAALFKKIFNKAGYNIKNYEDVVLDGSTYPLKIILYYKIKDGDVVSTHEETVAVNETFATHVSKWITWLESLASTASLPQQFLFLRLYDWYGAVNAPQLKVALDLLGCKFEIHSKSVAKLQNRSIGPGGTTTESVDNVPLKGKYFDYRTNAVLFRDYNEPAAATRSALTTERFRGTLPKFQLDDVTGTNMYKDMPLVNQFVGVKKYGDVRISPGDFKESSMYDKTTITLNKLIQTILAKGYGDMTNRRYNQIWLGKTRLFAFEKELHTTIGSSTDGFSIKLGFEHQVEIGSICKIVQSKFSSPRIDTINTEL